jgi:hypothetical protein
MNAHKIAGQPFVYTPLPTWTRNLHPKTTILKPDFDDADNLPFEIMEGIDNKLFFDSGKLTKWANAQILYRRLFLGPLKDLITQSHDRKSIALRGIAGALWDSGSKVFSINEIIRSGGDINRQGALDVWIPEVNDESYLVPFEWSLLHTTEIRRNVGYSKDSVYPLVLVLDRNRLSPSSMNPYRHYLPKIQESAILKAIVMPMPVALDPDIN